MRIDSDMALFKYFSRVPTLPAKVPSLSEKELERTNADVKQVLEGDNKGRGKYNEYTSEVRAQIGKYAAEHGPAKAVRHFSKLSSPRTQLSTVSSIAAQNNRHLDQQ